MDVEGLWVAEFSTSGGHGNGVATLFGGRVFGGDASYYYSGRYREEGQTLRAELEIVHYAGPLNMVFGQLRRATLLLEGAVGGDLIVAQGRVAELPGTMGGGTFKLRRVRRL